MAVPIAVLDGTAGPYDDPKAWILPVLAALTVLGWVIDGRAPGGVVPPSPDRAGRALRAIALACVGWAAVSALASVAPGLSVLGNFGRGMGLVTIASAAALFFVAEGACRGADGAARVVDAVLLGSAPVCLLALGQAAGWDPLPRAWDPAIAELPVRSTLGQHTLLGGYLACVIPLAAARLEFARRQPRVAPTGGAAGAAAPLGVGLVWTAGVVTITGLASRWPALGWTLPAWGVAGAVAWTLAARSAPLPHQARIAAPGALLLAQLAVLVLSRARGPLFGVLLGLGVMGFAVLWRRRAWRPLAAGAVVAALLVAALALLNVPGSPLAPLARVKLLERLANVANTAPGTPGWFRLQVWRSVGAAWAAQLRGDAVVPGTTPLLRSLIGFGPETELIALDPMAQRALGRLVTVQPGWVAYYQVDRAHNTLLEHLVRGGLVGAVLWVALLAALAVVARAHLARDGTDAGAVMRLGGIGAIAAHVAEGQVGIASVTTLALFWMTAGWTAAPWEAGTADGPAPAAAMSRRARAAAVALILVAAMAGWATTRWLLASRAYAAGALANVAGRPSEARDGFRRSRALMPWLPLPAEALAQTSLQLASSEADASRRLDVLREGEAALRDLRRHAMPGASDWSLAAQVALAESRAGDALKLGASLEAFARAAQLSPRNPDLLAQWGWALLQARDPAGARRAAEEALSASPPPGRWFAWAVLALASRDLGDAAREDQARSMARRVAPPSARPTLNAILP